jgi:hypothetical protein
VNRVRLRVCMRGVPIAAGRKGGGKMNDETSRTQARRGYAVIDQADEVDVTSYDSFPASDPPSWIATGIGSPHLEELAADDATRTPRGSSTVAPDIEQHGAGGVPPPRH